MIVKRKVFYTRFIENETVPFRNCTMTDQKLGDWENFAVRFYFVKFCTIVFDGHLHGTSRKWLFSLESEKGTVDSGRNDMRRRTCIHCGRVENRSVKSVQGFGFQSGARNDQNGTGSIEDRVADGVRRASKASGIRNERRMSNR